jgi:HEXXH motif-containing protein
MTETVHQLSRATFEAVASGNGGADAVRELAAAEFSKHVILLQGVVRVAGETGHAQYALARDGFKVLAAAMRENPAAAERVIRYPPVGVWARRAVMTLRGDPLATGAEPGALAAVGAAAALAAGLTATIDVPVTAGLAVLPSLGAAVAQGSHVAVHSGSERVAGDVAIPTDTHHDGHGWLGLRRIQAGSLDVLLDDLDPHRMPEQRDLAPRGAVGPWEQVIRHAWRILAGHHPSAAAEIAGIIAVIVPRSEPPSGTVSTSSSEAFGTVAMSLPPDPVNCAETLVHETQHLKLAAVQELATLTYPDGDSRFYAPWRDDPRPASGLLQGAYAYIGVSRFWRKQRWREDDQGRGHVEYARWREAVSEVVATLQSSGRLTGAGQEFTDGMARELRRWKGDDIPRQAAERAQRITLDHRTQWESVNGRSSA